jgi:hypothetical protein
MSDPARRRALGDQAIHLIRESGDLARDIDRAARRARIDAACVRPVPGTSDLLGRPLRYEEVPGVGMDGKLQIVEVHDLTAMAPCHLLGLDLTAPLPGTKGGAR